MSSKKKAETKPPADKYEDKLAIKGMLDDAVKAPFIKKKEPTKKGS